MARYIIDTPTAQGAVLVAKEFPETFFCGTSFQFFSIIINIVEEK